MSQNDFNLANQGFPSMRSDMNSAFQALASNSAGDTEPATTYSYQWWYDSTANVLKLRNSDNDGWISFATFDQATDTWTADINGGTIDGTVIGGTTPAAVTGTTVTSTGATNAASLQILSATDDQITLVHDSTVSGPNIVFSNNDGSLARIASGETNTLSFEVGPSNSEAMRLDSSGNLLINRTATDRAAKLRVDLDSGTNGAAVYISRLGSTVSKAQIEFANDNGVVGSIKTSGSATSYNTSSDYRLKTDAQPMAGASDRVQALNPVNFEWISDGSRVDGFLAHEAQEVVPEAVSGTKDAVDADGKPEYQGIDQSKLVPLLTAALQEALTKIEAMEARLTALESV